MKAAACLAAILTLGLAAGAPAQGPMPPQPGPEHDILKKDVGVWDATLEMSFPGAPPMTMDGVETNVLMGGRWLISKYESDMMGQLFEGRGITGWDPAKKAYVGIWADTMGTEMTHAEATYDAETNTMTGWMEMPDPMGGKTKAKTVATWPDEDSRVVKVYGPDGGDEPFMTFTYARRK